MIALLRFSSFIAPTNTLSASILFLSNDTATSRPDNVADKTLFSTDALFSEVSCFLLLDASFLSEVTFGVSFLFSGTGCSFDSSFLSSTFSGFLFSLGASFLSEVIFSSLVISFLFSFFTDSLFSFLFSVTFSISLFVFYPQ